MRMWRRRIPAILAAGSALSGPAQAQDPGARLVELTTILGRASDASSRTKIEAIQELAGSGQVSSLAASLLFDRANPQMEFDAEVREAAALAAPKACLPRNRMAALRLVRIADERSEPDPRVRAAALRGLAGFQVAEAAARVYDSATASRESDPAVRKVASELIDKGLASSAY